MQGKCTSTHRITSIIRRMVKRFQCFEQFAEMFLSWTGATLKINFNESTEYIKIIASRYCLVKCASIVKAPKNNAWQTWCSFVKYMAEDMHISLYFPLFVHTDSRKKSHPVIQDKCTHVVFASWQVTFHPHLPDKWGCRQVVCQLIQNKVNQDLPRASKFWEQLVSTARWN